VDRAACWAKGKSAVCCALVAASLARGMAVYPFDGMHDFPGATVWVATIFRSSEIGSMPLRVVVGSYRGMGHWLDAGGGLLQGRFDVVVR
jgi:hypothetical protein